MSPTEISSTGEVEQLVHDLAHGFRRDLPLVRTAERGRDVAAHADLLLARARDDGAEALDRLVHAGVDVLAVERLGGGREHGDLAHARRERALESLHVGDEGRIPHAARGVDAPVELLRVGELRNRLRRDEGADLDRRQARLGQPVDELGAHLDGSVSASFWRPSRGPTS